MTEPTPSGIPPSPAPRQRPLTQDEKIVIGCSLGVAVLCILPWWSVSFGEGTAEMGAFMASMGAKAHTSANAFSHTLGIFVFLLSLATAAVPFVQSQGFIALQPRVEILAPLATSAGALLFAIIYFGSGGGTTGFVSVSRTFWFYVALLLLGFTTWKCFQRWQAATRTGV